jgi:hypothetical protein
MDSGLRRNDPVDVAEFKEVQCELSPHLAVEVGRRGRWRWTATNVGSNSHAMVR